MSFPSDSSAFPLSLPPPFLFFFNSLKKLLQNVKTMSLGNKIFGHVILWIIIKCHLKCIKTWHWIDVIGQLHDFNETMYLLFFILKKKKRKKKKNKNKKRRERKNMWSCLGNEMMRGLTRVTPTLGWANPFLSLLGFFPTSPFNHILSFHQVYSYRIIQPHGYTLVFFFIL